jgi:hypothetical protein
MDWIGLCDTAGEMVKHGVRFEFGDYRLVSGKVYSMQTANFALLSTRASISGGVRMGTATQDNTSTRSRKNGILFSCNKLNHIFALNASMLC